MDTLTSELLLPSLPARRKSGRAVCSERGDAVWEWQVATGVFERDVTAEQIRLLEAPGLQIVETFEGSEDSGRWIHDPRPTLPAVSKGRHPLIKPQRRRAGPLGTILARLLGV